MNNQRNNKGFSLVELIIVIAIMAVLTALLAPQFLKYVEKARESRDEANIAALHRTIQVVLADEEVIGKISFTFFDSTTQTLDSAYPDMTKVVYGRTSSDSYVRGRVQNAGTSLDPSANFMLAEALANVFGKPYSSGSAWFPLEDLVSTKYKNKNIVFAIYLDKATGDFIIIKKILDR